MMKTIVITALTLFFVSSPTTQQPPPYTPKPYHCCKHLDPNMHPPEREPEGLPGWFGPDGYLPPEWVDSDGKLTPEAIAALQLPPIGD